MGEQESKEYEIAVYGSGGVGKSCLTLQFTLSWFMDEYDRPEIDSYKKSILIDEQMTNLDILDTVGQQTMCEDDCHTECRKRRRQDGYLFVYSITDRVSFEELVPLQQSISRHRKLQNISSEDSFPMILVGNKSDLEVERQVSAEEGAELAQQFGCKFLETSAKDRINVEEAFFDLVRGIKVLEPPPEPPKESDRPKDLGQYFEKYVKRASAASYTLFSPTESKHGHKGSIQSRAIPEEGESKPKKGGFFGKIKRSLTIHHRKKKDGASGKFIKV